MRDPSDATEIAEIHLAARHEAMLVGDRASAWWVARIRNEIVGYMLIDGTDLDHLYVRRSWQGRGIGLSLLSKAKALSPQRVALCTFQRNANAIRAVAYTYGRNEENEPDMKYE